MMQNLKDLKQEADTWFSRLVRLEACNHNGVCRCFVTGEEVDAKYIEAGHYILRRHLKHRYNPINVHPQSVVSNRTEDGDHDTYRAALIKEYGLKVVQGLESPSEPQKLTKIDYQEMIAGYKVRIKEILKDKGLEKWW